MKVGSLGESGKGNSWYGLPSLSLPPVPERGAKNAVLA